MRRFTAYLLPSCICPTGHFGQKHMETAGIRARPRQHHFARLTLWTAGLIRHGPLNLSLPRNT